MKLPIKSTKKIRERIFNTIRQSEFGSALGVIDRLYRTKAL
jgi:hypothetical protein